MTTPTLERMRALSARLYIDGHFVASSGDIHPVIDPASLEPLGHYAQASTDEVERAVIGARTAQRAWWALSSTERAQALHTVANRMEAIAPAVGECLTREMGKPFRESHWEAGASASAFRYYAELARHDQGRVAGPAVAGQWHMSFKEPLGTIVSIVPYNFPALLFGWQAAAALAAGNAVIVKPSELTSLTLLMLMDAFADLPPGLVQLLTGDAAVGAQLVRHAHTHGIAFTGSVRAAQAVAQAAAERFKPVLTEASGNDPFIVMPSAPVEVVARGAAFAAFLNCGQVCTSAERFYVHEAVYEPFVQALTRHALALRLGHGLGAVDMGPLANARELLRVERVLARAVEQGAVVRCGNRRPPHLAQGWFWEPTVLEVRHDMDILHQEIFGPIAPVCKVASFDEAIRYANDSEFGLGANLYTHDLNEAMRAVAEIESGIVWVNTPLNDNDCVAFGGRKMTGSGRELGAEGLAQFRRSKMVMMAPQALADAEWFPYPDADAFAHGG